MSVLTGNRRLDLFLPGSRLATPQPPAEDRDNAHEGKQNHAQRYKRCDLKREYGKEHCRKP